MLENYVQNADLGMTKEKYFEMCEMLAEEVVEEQIPVELDDFPAEVQEALLVYRALKDDFDSFNGEYLGKSLIGILDIFEILEVDKKARSYVFDLIKTIDSVRKEQFKIKKAQSPSS